MTKSKAAEKIESTPSSFRPSDELNAVLATLTPKQRRAIPLLVEQDLAGLTREDLFKPGPRKICHRSVYFDNWTKNKIFRAALALALAEARPVVMQNVVTDTVARLKQIAPLAANDLERQIVGDAPAIEALRRVVENSRRPPDERLAAMESLARIGTRAATDILTPLLENVDPDLRRKAAQLLGSSASGVDVHRRMADIAVLNRADKETASKSPESEEDLDDLGARRWAQIAPLLKQMQEEAPDAALVAPTPVSN